MTRAIHEVLDGDRSRDGLNARELDELVRLEALVASVAAPLDGAESPDLTESVMTRVIDSAQAVSGRRRLVPAVQEFFAWAMTPRLIMVRLRPASAVGAFGFIALLALITPSLRAPDIQGLPVLAGAEDAITQVYVQFRLEASGASHVALVGSFTGWSPVYELRETTAGIWSVLLPLQPGVHDYSFIVDGTEWVADPHALQVDDGFGGVNSRIALPSLPATDRKS
jgi:hypothetical protein